MKLSDQIHAPPALPQEKNPWHKFPGIVTDPFFPRFHTRKEGVHQREDVP
jgi:hypothetical protein